jgi:hypothetical protein
VDVKLLERLERVGKQHHLEEEGEDNMSLRKKHIREMIRDEEMGNKEYLKAAKKSKLKKWKERFRMMARDERRHKKYLKEMERDMK